MTKLFGTDGVRGTANIHPMTADMALRIGAAVGQYFRRDATGGSPRGDWQGHATIGLHV